MDIINNKTDQELLRSLVVELAKAKNELSCARGDIDKINSRISFLLVVANTLIERQGD